MLLDLIELPWPPHHVLCNILCQYDVLPRFWSYGKKWVNLPRMVVHRGDCHQGCKRTLLIWWAFFSWQARNSWRSGMYDLQCTLGEMIVALWRLILGEFSKHLYMKKVTNRRARGGKKYLRIESKESHDFLGHNLRGKMVPIAQKSKVHRPGT
jgi:hypothetical protein